MRWTNRLAACVLGLLLLIPAVLLPIPGWAAIAFVQSKWCTVISTAADSMTCAFTNPTSAGGVIVAVTGILNGTVTAVTFTDNQSGVYSTPQEQLGCAACGGAIGVGTVGTPGSTTVTVTWTNSSQPTNYGVCLMEFSGVDTVSPIDVSDSNEQTSPGTATDGVTSTAQVTTADNEWIVGGAWGVTGVTNTYAAGTGFTERENTVVASHPRGVCETLAQTSQGSVALTATSLVSTTEDTVSFMVALKVAAQTVVPRVNGLIPGVHF